MAGERCAGSRSAVVLRHRPRPRFTDAAAQRADDAWTDGELRPDGMMRPDDELDRQPAASEPDDALVRPSRP